jgi:hypothetical protein
MCTDEGRWGKGLKVVNEDVDLCGEYVGGVQTTSFWPSENEVALLGVAHVLGVGQIGELYHGQHWSLLLWGKKVAMVISSFTKPWL